MTAADEKKLCERCGAFGDLEHTWIEGDCILPHGWSNKTHPPRAKHGQVCGSHVERHQSILSEIVDLYAGLTEVIPAGSIPDDTAAHQHTKKAPASPSPVRLEAWVLVEDADRLWARPPKEQDGTYTGDYRKGLPDVAAVLAGWSEALHDAQNHTTPTAGQAVSSSVTHLRGHAELTAVQPWIDDYDAELTWIRRALRQAHGISDPVPLGKCLTVAAGRDCTGYVWPKPAAMPKCDRCGRSYGTLDLVRMHAMDDREASA